MIELNASLMTYDPVVYQQSFIIVVIKIVSLLSNLRFITNLEKQLQNRIACLV